MKEITVNTLQELENNKEFVEKMNDCETPAQMVAVMAEYGVACTEADFSQITADANGELSADALDNVAGGGLFSWLYNKLKEKNIRDLKKLSGI
jgi:predicted ribosomally synthesized peptide with nif11-like leader